MHPLDNPETYRRFDPSGLRTRIAGLPQQCQDAWEAALAAPLPRTYVHVNKVVLTGMGGSAIGGDILRDLAALEDGPAVTVSRDYHLPRWVSDDTLIIASSYSGNTEETLTAFEEALRQGCRIVVLTGGGRLRELAERHALPTVLVDFEGEPRSALGYSLLGPLAVLVKLGLLQEKAADVADAVGVLEEQGRKLREDVPLEDNPAKQMAVALHGRLPVVWGAGILTAAARRWKTQFNENAKVWSFVEVLPEAHHNSVVGFPLPQAAKEVAYLLLLQPCLLHARVALRYAVSQELLEREGVAHRLVKAREGSPLAQVLSTVQLGDYVSYYLAMLNGVDPSPVQVIDWLKERLAQE